jgi:hypothetical protein
MVGIDPRTEIPPTGLIPFRQRRRPTTPESFAATVDSGMRSRPRHVSAEARSSHS